MRQTLRSPMSFVFLAPAVKLLSKPIKDSNRIREKKEANWNKSLIPQSRLEFSNSLKPRRPASIEMAYKLIWILFTPPHSTAIKINGILVGVIFFATSFAIDRKFLVARNKHSANVLDDAWTSSDWNLNELRGGIRNFL